MSTEKQGGQWLLIAAIGLSLFWVKSGGIPMSARLSLESARNFGRPVAITPKIVRGLVDEAAYEQGIDPHILHGLIHVESRGNRLAVSGAGAKGLTQLLNSTGREWHKKLAINRPYDPYDVTQSVRIGAAYLRHLIDMYDGNVELALTAYNQGYGRVNNLMAKKKAKSLSGIIAHLGPDGRAYARNVLAAASRVRG